MIHRPTRARGDGDRGIVLILVAVAMIAILAVAAMAIDLGTKRSNRRSDQTVADLASLAAGYFLAGNGSATTMFSPNLACRGALTSAQANVPEFTPTQNPVTACAALPVDASTLCTGATVPVDVVFSDTRHTLSIRYPIPTNELTDIRFAGGTGSEDGTQRCERMRVTFSETSPTTFARVIGVNEQVTQASAIVRSTSTASVLNVPTLVLFERSNCGVLYTGGQGTFIIEAPSSSNPAWIQLDSEGKGTCTNNDNEGGRVVYAASTGNSRIEIQPTAAGTPGLLGMYSVNPAVNGRGSSTYTGPSASNGVSLQPSATEVVSRAPVDLAFNSPSRDAITQLHARAWSRVTAPPSGTYTLVNGSQCNGPGPILGTVVYVDCPEFVAGAASSFTQASDVYFTGKVTVANNMSLSLPLVQRLYIRGCRVTGSPASGSTNCGNNATSTSNAYALSVNGTLLVNTTTFAPCASYTPTIGGELFHRITEVATLGGPVIVGGGANLAMCQATLYVGRTGATYLPLHRTFGAPNCTTLKPCPADAGTTWIDEGYVNMGGGNGVVHWSAPNRMAEPANAANPLESLALWAESARPSFLKGTGASSSTGVFFTPNSAVSFQGQGAQAVPQNAQYFARSLTISGQGTLRVRPNPGDALLFPRPGGYALIR